MWKLVSGIALIVVLDVAFIWMVALEPDSPEIAQNIGPTAALPVVHDQQISEPAVIDDSTEPVADDSLQVRHVRESRTIGHVRDSRTNRHGTDTVSRVAQLDTPVVAATAPAKLFEDTIIWIGRTEVPVKIDQREEAPVITESGLDEPMQASIAEPLTANKKKRSFESKAFGVIKRPYDWIKALADKLH